MNVEKIREDFPLLKQKFNGKQVVYLPHKNQNKLLKQSRITILTIMRMFTEV